MSAPSAGSCDLRAVAIARRHAAHSAICDRMLPWGHGTVILATPYPSYWDFNALRVEGPVPPELTATTLAEEAERHLGRLAHRKAEIEDEGTGAALAAGLGRLGWHVDRLVHMRRDGTIPAAMATPGVAELPREAVDDLRTEWYLEEKTMPDEAGIRDFLVEEDAARAALPGTLVALGQPGTAFVTLRLEGGASAEIEDAYVSASARGSGLGTTLLHAAIARAHEAGVRDLWIVADADGRPRELYGRLGFEPVWTAWECVRRPTA